MKYNQPTIKVSEAEAARMLAESLALNTNTPVDGSEALAREDAAWDIWNTDED